MEHTEQSESISGWSFSFKGHFVNITDLSAFPWVTEPLCYSCLHALPPWDYSTKSCKYAKQIN